jgi:hypothetical protein
MAFQATIFRKFTNSPQYHMQISDTKFHPNRMINAKGTDRNAVSFHYTHFHEIQVLDKKMYTLENQGHGRPSVKYGFSRELPALSCIKRTPPVPNLIQIRQ